MHKPAPPNDPLNALALFILAAFWGGALSAAAFEVGVLVAEAIHLPLAKDYFGSAVSISGERMFVAAMKALFGLLAYVAAWALALWLTESQAPKLRLWLRLCVLVFAVPGASVGLTVAMIGALFTKGVA